MATSALVGAALAPVASDLISKGAAAGGGALGGAVGSLFGKKGKVIGKKVGREVGKIARKLIPFEQGGKVRVPPSVLSPAGYRKGGRVRRNKK